MCTLCEKGLATPWDARCRDYKEVKGEGSKAGTLEVGPVGVFDGRGGDPQLHGSSGKGSSGGGAPPRPQGAVKQRWGREAYNVYMKGYMARRRSGLRK